MRHSKPKALTLVHQEHTPLWPPPQPSNAHCVDEPRISARLSEKMHNMSTQAAKIGNELHDFTPGEARFGAEIGVHTFSMM